MSVFYLDSSALVKREHPPLIFVTSDEDLRAAAHAESLATEDPVDG